MTGVVLLLFAGLPCVLAAAAASHSGASSDIGANVLLTAGGHTKDLFPVDETDVTNPHSIRHHSHHQHQQYEQQPQEQDKQEQEQQENQVEVEQQQQQQQQQHTEHQQQRNTDDQQNLENEDHLHRVHNLVLNPQQHSLCELRHIRQIVTHPQCQPQEMENYVCVGTCFSYAVPHTEPNTPGDELLDYCDSCQASDFHWETIELNCEKYGNPYVVMKRIQMITNCSCSPCRPPQSHVPEEDNEVNYQPNEHRVSELLFKMLPEGHRFKDNGVTRSPDDLAYTQVSLGDLKKELNLDDAQEQLLQGKLLFMHSLSYTGPEETELEEEEEEQVGEEEDDDDEEEEEEEIYEEVEDSMGLSY